MERRWELAEDWNTPGFVEIDPDADMVLLRAQVTAEALYEQEIDLGTAVLKGKFAGTVYIVLGLTPEQAREIGRHLLTADADLPA